MSQSGYMGELKELRCLSSFLNQIALQVKGTAYLLQLDETIIGLSDLTSKIEGANSKTVQQQPQAIIKIWHDSGLSKQPYEASLNGQPLFIIPICVENQTDGILAVYPYAESKRSFLLSVADMITAYLKLARSAINSVDQAFDMRNVLEQLYQETRQVDSLEDFCRYTLSIILRYLDTDINLFIPYNPDRSKWEAPVIDNKVKISQGWLDKFLPIVTRLSDENRCPRILTEQYQKDYSELIPLGFSVFVSLTLSYHEEKLGLLIFCSFSKDCIVSFNELALLESLRGVICLSLHNLRHSKFRERFFDNALHSFRSPAHSVVALVEKLAANKIKSSNRYLEDLELLRQQAQYLANLMHGTGQLRQLRRVSYLQDKTSKSIISLNQIVTESVQGLKALIEETGIKLIYNPPDDDCEINANKNGLRIVLNNLLENAFKHSQAGQTIFIELIIDPEYYNISIVDEGPGVPEDQKKIIFEEYTSIPRRNDTPKSMGLGLAIAREIVEDHSGNIICTDALNTQGACFLFKLPRTHNIGE